MRRCGLGNHFSPVEPDRQTRVWRSRYRGGQCIHIAGRAGLTPIPRILNLPSSSSSYLSDGCSRGGRHRWRRLAGGWRDSADWAKFWPPPLCVYSDWGEFKGFPTPTIRSIYSCGARECYGCALQPKHLNPRPVPLSYTIGPNKPTELCLDFSMLVDCKGICG